MAGWFPCLGRALLGGEGRARNNVPQVGMSTDVRSPPAWLPHGDVCKSSELCSPLVFPEARS